jgi:hypothetical protein
MCYEQSTRSQVYEIQTNLETHFVSCLNFHMMPSTEHLYIVSEFKQCPALNTCSMSAQAWNCCSVTHTTHYHYVLVLPPASQALILKSLHLTHTVYSYSSYSTGTVFTMDTKCVPCEVQIELLNII